jgi:hypothetical protein
MHRFDEAGLDGRDQRRMRIERPVRADLALQAEVGGVGRQQQLDRRGVETDAVVQPRHAIFGVDALDRHHRHQHLDFGDLRRVAGKERLNVVRLGGEHREIDPVGRHVDARQLVEALVDLGDDDAALEGGRLDDGRGVFGVRPEVEIALGIGGLGRDQRHIRRQIHEVAAEQFEIGVDRPDLDALFLDQLSQPGALRAAERKVEAVCQAALEKVHMAG